MLNKKILSLALSIGCIIAANCLHAMDNVSAAAPYIKDLSAKMGVRFPVVTTEASHLSSLAKKDDFCDGGYDNFPVLTSTENMPISHQIWLTTDTLVHLSDPSSGQYHLAIALMCHELLPRSGFV